MSEVNRQHLKSLIDAYRALQPAVDYLEGDDDANEPKSAIEFQRDIAAAIVGLVDDGLTPLIVNAAGHLD